MSLQHVLSKTIVPGQDGEPLERGPGRGAAAPRRDRWEDSCSINECWGASVCGHANVLTQNLIQ